MRKLVIASANTGKLRELSQLFVNLDYQLYPQADFDVPEVAETGTTFVETQLSRLVMRQSTPALPHWRMIRVSRSML